MNRINKGLNQRGDKMVKFHKAAEEAIDIGSRLELSVDDYLIEVMDGWRGIYWTSAYLLAKVILPSTSGDTGVNF